MNIPVNPSVIRTERGLTIVGTRITLYDVMDYLGAGYSLALIREKLGLSEAQMEAASRYIEAHRTAVETEYQNVLEVAAENRRYWEGRNRDRFEKVKAMPVRPEQTALRAKLRAWKKRLDVS